MIIVFHMKLSNVLLRSVKNCVGILMGIALDQDALLSLDAGGRGLVLPQLNMPGFVDSLWEPLPIGKSG